MSELTSPLFDDVVLVAYIDEVLDAERRRAVDSSAESLERVSVLRAELDALARLAKRALCPSGEHLAAFLAGDLTEDQERAVGAHVAWCAACGDELVEMRTFLQDIASDVELGGAAVPTHGPLRWLVTAFGGARSGDRGRPSPAARAMALPSAGLRGGESDAQTFDVEGLRIVITTEDDPGDPSLRSLSAIVFPVDDALVAPATGWSVELIGSDGSRYVGNLDDLNEVTFDGLPQSEYALTLIGTDLRVLIPGLAV